MVVTEIFKSIQGESTYAGLPCVFVRLTGCNLRCKWCDTAYAFYRGTRLSVEEVCQQVRRLSLPDGSADASSPMIRLVETTGGEPLLQADVPDLAAKLLAQDYAVLIETSG